MKTISRIASCLMILVLLVLGMQAFAQGTVSTTLNMRVTKAVQSALVNEGEDLTIDIEVDGVAPEYYQWYFNDELIPGATYSAYTIANAKVEDAGMYRLDAYDENSKLLFSTETKARVLDSNVPKSGDRSLNPVIPACIMLSALLGLFIVFKRTAK